MRTLNAALSKTLDLPLVRARFEALGVEIPEPSAAARNTLPISPLRKSRAGRFDQGEWRIGGLISPATGHTHSAISLSPI